MSPHYGPPYIRKPGGPNVAQNCGCCPDPPAPPPACVAFEDTFTQANGTPPDPTNWDVSSAAVNVQSDKLLVPNGEWVEMLAPASMDTTDVRYTFFMDLSAGDMTTIKQTAYNGSGLPDDEWWLEVEVDKVTYRDSSGSFVEMLTGTGQALQLDFVGSSSTGGPFVQMRLSRSGGTVFVADTLWPDNTTSGVRSYRMTSTNGQMLFDRFLTQSVHLDTQPNPFDCDLVPDIWFCRTFIGDIDRVSGLGTAPHVYDFMVVPSLVDNEDANGCQECLQFNGLSILFRTGQPNAANDCQATTLTTPVAACPAVFAPLSGFGGVDFNFSKDFGAIMRIAPEDPQFAGKLQLGLMVADVGTRIDPDIPRTLSYVQGQDLSHNCNWEATTLLVTLL